MIIFLMTSGGKATSLVNYYLLRFIVCLPIWYFDNNGQMRQLESFCLCFFFQRNLPSLRNLGVNHCVYHIRGSSYDLEGCAGVVRKIIKYFSPLIS